MKYYPIFLDISGRACLVVGGGAVGARKVKTLLACGAAVTVVSPGPAPELVALARRGDIVLEQRAYRSSDIGASFLVIGATDDQALNRRVHADAEKAGRLCNIADKPELCNFVLPAIVTQDDLVVAISTSGRSPALAKELRRRLQAQFGPEYGRFLRLMGGVRDRLLAAEHAPEAHKPLFEELIRSDLLDAVRDEDVEAIDAILARVLGAGFRYRELMEK